MSRKLLDKNFCVLPWTGFELEPNGVVKNCIISKETIGNIHQNSIEDILQSKKNLEIKTQMLNKEFPNNCTGCYFQEKDRATSFESISSRLYYAKELGPHITNDLLDSKNKFDLSHVDLRWTNHCNQACVYCSPEYSSKWATELGKTIKSDKRTRDQVKKYVFNNVKQLKNIYLAGGEPLLINENRAFLKLLLEKNPDVHIRVNTNLSSTKTGVFQMLCKFKNVHWTVSVESIKEEYEYVRYHGVWNDFLKNLKYIQTLNHKISFNMLYFILNYKSIFDCIDYFKSIGFHNNSFILGPLYTPLFLNVKHLPENIKKEVITIFENKINEKPGFYLQNSLENCLKYLTQTGFHANIKLVHNGIKEMDERRKLNSRKIFPKLYKEVLK
jgi:radical SAM protein with 4Fe4S-binding SPASM domain